MKQNRFFNSKALKTIVLMVFAFWGVIVVNAQTTVTATFGSSTVYGSGSIIIPDKATDVESEAWGGGGGGGGVNALAGGQANGGGGGGGAYVIKNYGNISGTISFTIGAGGARGENYATGSVGGNSIVTYSGVTVTAGGGGGGERRYADCCFGKSGGAGGTGGKQISGDAGSQNGGDGYNHNANPASAGGLSPNGGGITAQPINGNNAIKGNFPGGGGSGARDYGCTCRQPGAAGANGQVKITFTLPKPIINNPAPICAGSSTELSVQNPSANTYTWKLNGITQGTGTTWLATQAGSWTVVATYNIAYTGLTPTFTGTTSGNTVEITSDIVTLTVNPKPEGVSIPATSICDDVVSFDSPNENYLYSYNYNGNIGVDANAINLSDLTPGVHTVLVTPKSKIGGCVGEDFEIEINVYPETTTWTGSTDDWNSAANWSNGVPGTCTDVIIPTTTDNYPVISSPVSCHDITFEPHAAVFGLQHLTYEHAFVEMAFERNKWYTLTAPLQELVSGDFYFEGAPITYMRLFDCPHPDHGEHRQGQFSNSFSSLNAPLVVGEGFAFQVSDKEWDYPNGLLTDSEQKTVYLPRRGENNDAKPANDATLINTVYNYSSFTGQLYPFGMTLERDLSKVYRLAMDGAFENSLKTVEIHELETDGFFMVGNPTMSHLNFLDFYQENQDAIYDEVRFLKEGDIFATAKLIGEEFYSTEHISDLKTSADNVWFAPMQAFILKKRENAAAVHFDLNHFNPPAEQSKLRNATFADNRLRITVDNGTAGSSTLIAMNTAASNDLGSDDATKLFSSEARGAEVYTLASGAAVDINLFREAPFIAPVGLKPSLRATKGDTVKIHFNGAESFADMDVLLINRLTGEEKNLKDENSVEIVLTDTVNEGALYVEFRKAQETTGVDNTGKSEQSPIQIFATNNHTVRVLSTSDDLLRSVIIIDESGRTVLKTDNINASSFDAQMAAKPHIYLVRAITDRAVRTEKVMVK